MMDCLMMRIRRRRINQLCGRESCLSEEGERERDGVRCMLASGRDRINYHFSTRHGASERASGIAGGVCLALEGSWILGTSDPFSTPSHGVL